MGEEKGVDSSLHVIAGAQNRKIVCGVVVAVHGIDGHCRFEFMHFEGLKNGRATAA